MFDAWLIVLLALLVPVLSVRAEESKTISSIETLPFQATFQDGFEHAPTVSALFSPDLSRWHAIQREPEENKVEVTTERAHSGTQALKLYALPSGKGRASKADIELQTMRFGKGEQAWFSGWYFLKGGTNAQHLFLFDIETRQFPRSPGRRLYLSSEKEWIASDLGKWYRKYVFRQEKGKEIAFPKDRWVHLVVHLFLDDSSQGIMEVWQDGTKIIDGRGKTLPTADSVYHIVQVGITANGSRESAQTLYLDDITVSRHPLRQSAD